MEGPNRGPPLFGVNTTGVILSGVTCLLRCFVRTRVVKGFGLDDFLMVAATLCYIAFCSLSNSGIAHGTGRHKSDLTPEAYTRAMSLWWWCYITYAWTMIFVKLSIGCFLLRVTITRLHKWIIYMAAAITCVSCLVFFFLALFQCHPISYFWTRNQDLEGTQGKCIDPTILVALAYLYSVMSVITDLTFALLPAWVVSHLRMDKRAKMAVVGLMGMGVIASAAVIARAPYLQYMGSDDFLWDTAGIAIWSSVEAALAITAGCLATLQPLVKMIALKLGIISGITSSSLKDAAGGSGAGRLGGSGGDNVKMSGGVSVRRSITRQTEVFSSANYRAQQQQQQQKMQRDGSPDGTDELRLQPVGFASEYTAKCYGNTSEEELRPKGSSRGHHGKSGSLGLGGMGRGLGLGRSGGDVSPSPSTSPSSSEMARDT